MMKHIKWYHIVGGMVGASIPSAIWWLSGHDFPIPRGADLVMVVIMTVLLSALGVIISQLNDI